MRPTLLALLVFLSGSNPASAQIKPEALNAVDSGFKWLKKKDFASDRLHYETGSIETLKNLVDHHHGITILPHLATLDLSRKQKEKIREFARINRYHISLMPYLIEKLKNTPDGDGSLLDHSVVIYGSPMGNPNVHNHKRCPLLLAGHAGGALKGGLHLAAPDGTPMANVFLSVLHKLGMDDVDRFGDSTGEIDLNSVAAAPTAAGLNVPRPLNRGGSSRRDRRNTKNTKHL